MTYCSLGTIPPFIFPVSVSLPDQVNGYSQAAPACDRFQTVTPDLEVSALGAFFSPPPPPPPPRRPVSPTLAKDCEDGRALTTGFPS